MIDSSLGNTRLLLLPKKEIVKFKYQHHKETESKSMSTIKTLEDMKISHTFIVIKNSLKILKEFQFTTDLTQHSFSTLN